MVAKLLDSIVYLVGITSIGFFSFTWDKKFYIYNNYNKNIRKIYKMKYGIIPQQPVYQRFNTKKFEWEDLKDCKNSNDFEINSIFNIDDLKISLTVSDKKDSEELVLLNKILKN